MKSPNPAFFIAAAVVLGVAGVPGISHAQDVSAFAQAAAVVAFSLAPLEQYLPPAPAEPAAARKRHPQKATKAKPFAREFYVLYGKDGKPVGEMNCNPPVAPAVPLSLIGKENFNPFQNPYGYVNAPNAGPKFQRDFPMIFSDPGKCEFTREAVASHQYKNGVALIYTLQVKADHSSYGVIKEVGPASPDAQGDGAQPQQPQAADAGGGPG